MMKATRSAAMRALQTTTTGRSPRIALMEPPHRVDLAKYVQYFTEFSTLPEVWKAKNTEEAWSKLYSELRKSTPTERERLLLMDCAGLSRLSSNLEVSRVLLLMPQTIREAISAHPSFKLSELEEVFVHAGMSVEVRGHSWMFFIESSVAEQRDINHIVQRLAGFGQDGRSSLPGTLHRISAYKSKDGSIIGVTIRVGKYVAGAALALVPVVTRGSLLILSKPAVGKTTLLRDLAVHASQLPGFPRVVVIDTSCEVGGDGPTPLPFMNRVRRVLVPQRSLQSAAMLDALQNHSPDFIIVDEIANADEAEAAYTISQRGVKLIATCHAESLESLLQNSQLNKLVGGVAQAFLSNEERRLRGKVKKTILERPLASPFPFVLELRDRNTGKLFCDVNAAVDKYLDESPLEDVLKTIFTLPLNQTMPPSALRGMDQPSMDTTQLLGGVVARRVTLPQRGGGDSDRPYNTGSDDRQRDPQRNHRRRRNEDEKLFSGDDDDINF